MSWTFYLGVALIVACLSQTNVAWLKKNILSDFYFSAPIPNNIRCERLCQRQGKCVAASFGVVERKCYLHDTLPGAAPSVSGNYLFLALQNRESNGICNDTELRVPSAGPEKETCISLKLIGDRMNAGGSITTTTTTSGTEVQTNTVGELSTTSGSTASVSATSGSTTNGITTPGSTTTGSTTSGSTTTVRTTSGSNTTGSTTTESATTVEMSTVGEQLTTTGNTTTVSTTSGSTTTTSTTTESTTTGSTSTESKTTESVTTTNPCQNNQPYDGTRCVCGPGLSGDYCENAPMDCDGVVDQKWYDVYPEDGRGSITVFCWKSFLTVFAAEPNGFTAEFLNKSWVDYKMGFGGLKNNGDSADGAYWLGNENVFRITNGSLSYKLRFEAYVPGNQHGRYRKFRVYSERDNYQMSFSGYNSDDNLARILETSTQFSSVDRDNDGCALQWNTGFWFNNMCEPEPPLFGRVKDDNQIKDYTGGFFAYLKRL